MGLHNPLPSSLSSECKKCGKILTSFIDPRQSFLGPDKIIPPSVLANAKGLAILTVIKAGFLGSARFGSGLVVARLPNGSWSAPSAIATAGAGFGGQIGFEITDFVFILNDASAVKTFAQAGSLTLGGNVSIAAGPVGRNAEAAGAASLHSVAGIFAYSKTKGLFAGVSLEGSAIIERRDANEKLYNQRLTAAQLLSGAVPSPPQAAPLANILNSRIFSGNRQGAADDSMYNDIPVYGEARHSYAGPPPASSHASPPSTSNGHSRTASWQDPVYDRPYVSPTSPTSPRNPTATSPQDRQSFGTLGRSNTGSTSHSQKPDRPSAPKPNFGAKTAMLKKNEAVALFTFDADQPGDLGFKKGEIITVLKKTESESDWWTGMIGNRHGIFPSNYVKMQT